MKKNTFVPCLLLAAALSLQAEEGGGTTTSAVPRKPPTHEELAKAQKKQAEDRKRTTAEPSEPVVKAKKRSLIASSTLLAGGRHWTLVPRGAVVHVPPHLRDRIIAKPAGELLSWKAFLRKNQGWIHVLEINMAQAKGTRKIDPKTIKAYQSVGKVVIATCAKGPISVSPDALKPPAPEQEK